MFCGLLIAGVLGVGAPPDLCTAAVPALDAALGRVQGVEALARVGPGLREAQLRPLLASRPRQLGAYLAIGRSRHAAALRLMRSPMAEGYPLARGLGLLALGDASQLAQLKQAMKTAPLAERRALAEALSWLPQNRPRMVLYPALWDPDPHIRLVAAEAMLPRNSRRALTTLRALVKLPQLRERAIDALVETPEMLSRRTTEALGLPWSAIGEARALWPVSRRRLRRLPGKLTTRDAARRAAVWAVLAATGELSPVALQRLGERQARSLGAGVRREAAMARLLAGDRDALRARPLQTAHVRVLLAYGALPRRVIDASTATALAHALDATIRARSLPPQLLRQLYRLLSRLHPSAAVWLARRLLSRGGDRPLLRLAIDTLATRGGPQDLAPLLSLLDRASPELSSHLHAAIRARCAHQHTTP